MSAAQIDGPLTVSTDGGSLQLNGTAEANVDSGGGPVTAAQIDGLLTVSTDGGSLQLNGLAGPLRADTGGGPLFMQGVNAATATVSTGGGSARIDFSVAPDTVTLRTDGGPAMLAVPGGPYALTAESDGGPQSVGIATDPAARRSITVTSGGGSLQIGPGTRSPVHAPGQLVRFAAARDRRLRATGRPRPREAALRQRTAAARVSPVPIAPGRWTNDKTSSRQSRSSAARRRPLSWAASR